MAAVVAAQFIAYPFYAYDSQGNALDTARDVWLVIDWFMAVGLVIMLVTTLARKNAIKAQPEENSMDGDGSSSSSTDFCESIKQWVEANLMFYASVLLTLAFIPNWFAVTWSHGDNGTIWHIIDTVLPVLFAVQAWRIWFLTSDTKS